MAGLRSGPPAEFALGHDCGIAFLTLVSPDGWNLLTRAKVTTLLAAIHHLPTELSPVPPLVLSGTPVFSAGASLNEVRELSATEALAFARLGQDLMAAVEAYPGPVYGAISGPCLGGGLDLALACRRRIAAPDAVFGHRGAALGLITGWGGTQRLPRLIGRSKALEMLIAARKVDAEEALRLGLADEIAADPVAAARERIRQLRQPLDLRG